MSRTPVTDVSKPLLVSIDCSFHDCCKFVTDFRDVFSFQSYNLKIYLKKVNIKKVSFLDITSTFFQLNKL